MTTASVSKTPFVGPTVTGSFPCATEMPELAGSAEVLREYAPHPGTPRLDRQKPLSGAPPPRNFRHFAMSTCQKAQGRGGPGRMAIAALVHSGAAAFGSPSPP